MIPTRAPHNSPGRLRRALTCFNKKPCFRTDPSLELTSRIEARWRLIATRQRLADQASRTTTSATWRNSHRGEPTSIQEDRNREGQTTSDGPGGMGWGERRL